MENASLTVLFPRAMKAFIETQLREGDPSEYIRSLIQAFSRDSFAAKIYRSLTMRIGAQFNLLFLSAHPPNRRTAAVTDTRRLSFCKGRR